MNEQEIEKKIKENENLVYYILNKYFPSHLHDEDYQQLGMIALWRSIISFDESKNTQFSTYAAKSILNTIRNYYRRSEEAKNIKYSISVISIDEAIKQDDNGNELNLVDNISSSELDTFDFLTIDLKNIIDKLSEDEIKLMKLKELGLTQRDIAKVLGCHQANVSRISKRLYNKIMKSLEGK